jgi:hypothetical protein
MKKIKCVIFIFLSLFLFSACDNNANKEESKKEKNESKKKNESNEKTADEVKTENKVEEVKEKEPIQLSVGSVITTPEMEIKFNKFEFSYEVNPDIKDGGYSYYPADKGKVYVHVDADVKNLLKQSIGCDDLLTMIVDYDNGFTYNSMTVPEDSDLGFSYANITSISPLEILGVRFLADCPQEVEQSGKTVIIKFIINKEKYEFKLR